MRVFIEAERGSDIRYRYDEASLRLEGSRKLLAAYPYAYGFVLGSGAAGEDCLDCFVVSERRLERGSSVECEAVDVFMLEEGEEREAKLIGAVAGEAAGWGSREMRSIAAFLEEVFKDWPELRIRVGDPLGREEALRLLAGRLGS